MTVHSETRVPPNLSTRLLILWLLLPGLAGPIPAHAVLVEHMYRADVSVEDHSSEALQQATREGLSQVLVKASGSRSVLDSQQIRQALAGNRQYLQRYQYLRAGDGTLALQIHYDPQLVSDLLKRSGQPLWTAKRPSVLVWLVVDDGAGRRIASAGDAPQLIPVLAQDLVRRGVPAVFPLHDLEDSLALGAHNLWQLERLLIYRASARYAVEHILVGRLRAMSDGRWMGDWLYLSGGDGGFASSFYGKTLDESARSGSDFVAEQMAARYAVTAATVLSERVHIRVDRLDSYADYRALILLLEEIELVETAWPSYKEDSSMIITLRARADAGQLHRIIALDQRLQRIDRAEPLAGGERAELLYQWAP